MSVEPVGDTDVAVANSVIVDSVGAVSGTLSHAVVVNATATSAKSARRKDRPEPPCYHREKHNEAMQLAQETRSTERGFAMAGLLVSIALLSLAMSVAMPTWKTMAQREKEEELIWRGQQYDRAIQLYRKKNAAPGAPSVDKLVEGRFLRKKYKDPITNGDFELVGVSPAGNAPGVQQPQRGFGQLVGGVRSKSKAKSLRIVNGRSVYSDWQFTYVPWKPGGQPTAPGAQTPGGSPASHARQQTGAAAGLSPVAAAASASAARAGRAAPTPVAIPIDVGVGEAAGLTRAAPPPPRRAPAGAAAAARRRDRPVASGARDW